MPGDTMSQSSKRLQKYAAGSAMILTAIVLCWNIAETARNFMCAKEFHNLGEWFGRSVLANVWPSHFVGATESRWPPLYNDAPLRPHHVRIAHPLEPVTDINGNRIPALWDVWEQWGDPSVHIIGLAYVACCFAAARMLLGTPKSSVNSTRGMWWAWPTAKIALASFPVVLLATCATFVCQVAWFAAENFARREHASIPWVNTSAPALWFTAAGGILLAMLGIVLAAEVVCGLQDVPSDASRSHLTLLCPDCGYLRTTPDGSCPECGTCRKNERPLRWFGHSPTLRRRALVLACIVLGMLLNSPGVFGVLERIF
jgi:hypothetical protein